MTIKRTTSAYISILIFLLFAAACSKKSSLVIATVGGISITDEDLRVQIQLERSKYDDAVLKDGENAESFKKLCLDHLVEEAVLLDEAGRLGLQASDDEIGRMTKAQSGMIDPSDREIPFESRKIDRAQWEEKQRKRIVINKLIQQEVMKKAPVSKEAVASYYKSHIQEFRQPTQFRAYQIVVDSKELADEILAKLKNGADFSEMAKKFSLSPDSKRGGDLGYFDASSYPTVFAEICQNLDIGEISGVVETDYGYQIFQLIDRRDAYMKSLDEASPAIEDILREEVGEDAYVSWFGKLTEQAKITVDEEKLKEVKVEE